MKNLKLIKKLFGIVIIVFLIAPVLFSITEPASAKTDWLIRPPMMRVAWETEKIIETSKGSVPMLVISYENTDTKTHSIMVTAILESTTLTESGWRTDVIKDSNPSHAFTKQYVTDNTWGGNTDSCSDTLTGHKEGVMYIFLKVPSNTSLSLVKVTVTIKNNYNVPAAENAYLRIVGNITHNIFMATVPFPNTIKPAQTISHPISLLNSGPVPVSIGLAPVLTYTDSSGEPLDDSVWSVSFKNSRGIWDKILNNISQNSSEQFYLFLKAPPAEDAPAGAKLVIQVIASVTNDTRYGDSISLAPGKTDDGFTKGIKDEQDWGQLSFLTSGYWPYLMLIVFIFAVIVILFRVPKKRRKS